MKKAGYLIGGVLAGTMVVRQLYRQYKKIDVPGRVVLITGGSRGLGIIMARQLAREGARVVICAREQDNLVDSSHELSSLTDEFLAISCDISNKKEVEEMFTEIRNKFGEVEILINNAGIIQVGPMEEMTQEDYIDSLKVHYWGPYNVINEVLPSMVDKGWGRIVNIVSINGKISFPHLLPYTVGKHALAGYSEGISTELAKDGVRVTSVYPGLMRTGSPRNVSVKGKHEEEYAWFKISDSLPLLSMNAKQAARKIIDAMKRGDRSLTLGMPTRLALAMEGIFPGINLGIFELANKLLPKPEYNTEGKKGFQSESTVSSSFVTTKTDKAAEENNEYSH